MIKLLKGAVGLMNGDMYIYTYIYIYVCVAMIISTLNWNCKSKYRIGFLDISRKIGEFSEHFLMWESMLGWWSQPPSPVVFCKVSHEPLQSTGLDSQKTDPGGTSVFFWDFWGYGKMGGAQSMGILPNHPF